MSLDPKTMTESIVKVFKDKKIIVDSKSESEQLDPDSGETYKFLSAVAQGITDYLSTVSITVDTTSKTGKF